MKILITGGNGFIGLNLSNLLVKKGHTIINYDKNNQNKNKNKNKNITYIKGDILDFKNFDKTIKKSNIDILLHFAASLGVKNTNLNAFDCLKNNIGGTINVLESCVKNNVKKLLFASSSEVYGDGNNKPLSELSSLMPKSAYGVSKVTGEEYVKAYSKKYGITYNICRFFNVYGLSQRKEFVIPKFAHSIKYSNTVQTYGNGLQTRSFCHVNDAARGVEHVIRKGLKNNIYNVGNDLEPISIINLAKKMLIISKKNLKIKKVPFVKSDRSESREIFDRQPSIKKIKRDTGYKPIVNLDEGIEEFFEIN